MWEKSNEISSVPDLHTSMHTKNQNNFSFLFILSRRDVSKWFEMVKRVLNRNNYKNSSTKTNNNRKLNFVRHSILCCSRSFCLLPEQNQSFVHTICQPKRRFTFSRCKRVFRFSFWRCYATALSEIAVRQTIHRATPRHAIPHRFNCSMDLCAIIRSLSLLPTFSRFDCNECGSYTATR